MELNSQVTAALTDPAAIHNWLLRVPVNNDFTVVLTQLPGDYELSVWGPDGQLLGSSNFGGTMCPRSATNCRRPKRPSGICRSNCGRKSASWGGCD